MNLSAVDSTLSEGVFLRPYRIIDHEADVGFEVQANTLEELFLNSAQALFSVIVENSTFDPNAQRQFVISSDTDSLVVFLNELLYLWEIDKFIPASVNIFERNHLLEIRLSGTVLKNEDLIVGSVKAVTYHRFLVSEQNGLLKAAFIVDV